MNDPQLTLLEQRVIQPWVASIEQYVFEAELTKDQINQLFTNIEQGATDAGGNRTAIGKAKDIAGLPIEAVKWIDNKINELGGLVQKAGPVKNADAKFEELKQKIGSKDNKVVNAIKAVSDWAKENPGKASVAVGILTAAAAIAGGPLGGALAGFLARATKDILQGEKLSTAVGKSLKTAAYGALAGMTFNYLGDKVAELIGNAGDEAIANAAKNFKLDNVQNYKDSIPDDVMQVMTDSKDLIHARGSAIITVNGNTSVIGISHVLKPEQYDQWRGLLDAWKETPSAANFAKAIDFKNMIDATTDQSLLRQVMDASKELVKAGKELGPEQLDTIASMGNNLQDKLDFVKGLSSAAGAAAQGAAQAYEKENVEKISLPKEQTPKESKTYAGQKLSEGQIYLLFNRLTKTNDHMLESKMMFESVFDAVVYYNRQTINEGPLDAIKKGVGKLKQAGKNLTTKVTADKLMKAWNKAGSPTDSDEVYNVIKGLGVADDVIKGTYDSMKIEVPKATDAPDADKDAGAADADTNADAPTDSTAGDGGSDTTDTGAADTNAGGNEPAATDDTTDDTGAESPKAERYYLQKNTKDETKVDIIDKQTSKPIKNGVALAPEKAEPMSDKMNKEAGKFEPKAGERYTMQPNQQNPKTYDVIDTQTDQPVEKGAGLQPGDAEEMRDELNSKKDTTTTQQTSTTSTQDTTNTGVTDTDTASTSGDQDTSATTTPTDQVDANKDGLDDKTGNPIASNRGDGQGQNTAAPQKSPAPADINAIAAELKKLKPEQIEDAKKLLAA